MTTAEVAIYWRCKAATVMRKAKEGYLTARYLPGSRRRPLFHRDQVVSALPWPEPEGLRKPVVLPPADTAKVQALSPLARQLAGLAVERSSGAS
jgi:hypothetical protein